MISPRFIQQSEEKVSLIPHALRMCLNKENITRDLSGKFPSKQEDDLRKSGGNFHLCCRVKPVVRRGGEATGCRKELHGDGASIRLLSSWPP